MADISRLSVLRPAPGPNTEMFVAVAFGAATARRTRFAAAARCIVGPEIDGFDDFILLGHVSWGNDPKYRDRYHTHVAPKHKLGPVKRNNDL